MALLRERAVESSLCVHVMTGGHLALCRTGHTAQSQILKSNRRNFTDRRLVVGNKDTHGLELF